MNQFSLRSLFILVTVAAVLLWFCRGLLTGGEAFWGIIFLAVIGTLSGFAGILLARLDERLPR